MSRYNFDKQFFKYVFKKFDELFNGCILNNDNICTLMEILDDIVMVHFNVIMNKIAVFDIVEKLKKIGGLSIQQNGWIMWENMKIYNPFKLYSENIVVDDNEIKFVNCE